MSGLVSGPADSVVTYGAGGAAYVQVVGDWNGDGVQGVGLYELSTGSWFLRNTLTSGPAEISFAFGNFGNSNLIPISGNWTGEAGGDGVGLYDPATGAFFLRDTLDTGGIDREFGFAQPPPAGGYVPLAGQFGGVGQQDGVGVYDPSNGNFWLRATPDAGDATAAATFGPGDQGFVPLVGDWGGVGITGIGIYDPSNGNFWLRNDISSGAADQSLTYGPGGVDFEPVVGRWTAP